MAHSRRRFLKESAAALAVSCSGALAATAPPATKPKEVKLPLERSTFCVDLGPLKGAQHTITDYSGFHYCPPVDALLLFGGGHAATTEDVVLRFPIAAPEWIADYAATPLATMTTANPDGTLKYLTRGKFWEVPGQKPPRRPVSRHSYSGFLWSSAIERMVLLCSNNGASYGLPASTVGGNVAEYDPINRTWEDTGAAGNKAHVAYCEDPVSGNLLAIDSAGLRVYDPEKRRWLGDPVVPAPNMGYAENVVYFPPNDRFYYFGRNAIASTGTRVWEFALDRNSFRPVYTNVAGGRPAPMGTNWRPYTGGRETGYAYDATNQLIVGNLAAGVMLGFQPLGDGKGRWLQHPAPGTSSTTHYCHDYVERTNAHLLICDVAGKGKRTFAFRWDPTLAKEVVDTRPPPGPAAAITANGAAAPSLQAACNAGGEVRITAGELRNGTATANVGKPVNIVGEDTKLIATGIENKGILISNADLRLENLDISGASVTDGNGAAIRHQAGNVVLKRVKLHNNQNGILGPASSIPYSLEMDDCDVFGNGTGTGQTHGVYIGKIARFVCTNSRFWATRIGHHIKSRALVTIVQGCNVGTDFAGNESYNIDIPIGGDALVTECYMKQGPNTDNNVMLNFGSEKGPYPGGSLRVYGCTFESTAGGVGIRNALPEVVADIQDCDFIGVSTPVQGNHTRRNCRLNGNPLPDI